MINNILFFLWYKYLYGKRKFNNTLMILGSHFHSPVQPYQSHIERDMTNSSIQTYVPLNFKKEGWKYHCTQIVNWTACCMTNSFVPQYEIFSIRSDWSLIDSSKKNSYEKISHDQYYYFWIPIGSALAALILYFMGLERTYSCINHIIKHLCMLCQAL